MLKLFRVRSRRYHRHYRQEVIVAARDFMEATEVAVAGSLNRWGGVLDPETFPTYLGPAGPEQKTPGIVFIYSPTDNYIPKKWDGRDPHLDVWVHDLIKLTQSKQP